MDEQERSARRPFGRKRRANVRGGRMFSHRVRVAAEEEAALQGLAVQHGVGVVRLMVEAALSIAKQLELPRKAFNVDVPRGHVWHCSLSHMAVRAN